MKKFTKINESKTNKNLLNIDDIKDSFLEISDKYNMVDISAKSPSTIFRGDKTIYYRIMYGDGRRSIIIDISSFDTNLTNLYQFINITWSKKIKDRFGYHVEAFDSKYKFNEIQRLSIVID